MKLSIIVAILLVLCKVTAFAQHNIEYGDRTRMEYDSSVSRFVIKSKISDGRWNVYYHKILVEECTIIDSEKNGIDILYDFNGRRFSISSYIHNRKYGYEIIYDSVGFASQQYYYWDNKEKSLENFDTNGNINWTEQSFDGYTIEKTFYVNHKEKSELLSIDSLKNLNMLPSEYSMNISDTTIFVPYPFNGSFDSLPITLEDDNAEEGNSIIVRDKEKSFVAIQFHNFSRFWYEDGKIKEEIGKTDSLGTEKEFYYPNGSVKKEGHYKRNLRNGDWLFYDKNGRLQKTVLYRLGTVIGVLK